MIGTLGPRQIQWRNNMGESGVVTIIVRGLPDLAIDLGNGHIFYQRRAEIVISSSWQERTMFSLGSDDLQVIFQLLQFCSIYLTQISQERGVELDEAIGGPDLLTDFGVFRSAWVP